MAALYARPAEGGKNGPSVHPDGVMLATRTGETLRRMRDPIQRRGADGQRGRRAPALLVALAILALVPVAGSKESQDAVRSAAAARSSVSVPTEEPGGGGGATQEPIPTEAPVPTSEPAYLAKVKTAAPEQIVAKACIIMMQDGKAKSLQTGTNGYTCLIGPDGTPLCADENGTGYAQRYHTALQEHPDAVFAHRGVTAVLKEAPRTPERTH